MNSEDINMGVKIHDTYMKKYQVPLDEMMKMLNVNSALLLGC